jgi:hypothetical protein
MKILSYRDNDFDLPRSFLVLIMVISHVFQSFYIFDYNRHLTYFVLVGFVFLTGFTLSAVYHDRVIESPWFNIKRFMNRGFKLFIIFVICNIFTIMILPERLRHIALKTMLEIIKVAFFGTDQSLFAFDVLVPISITIFLCGFLIILSKRNSTSLLIIVFFWLILFLLEILKIFNYYSVKLIIVGIIGCLAANMALYLDWNKTIEKIKWNKFWFFSLGGAIFLYFAFLVFLNSLNVRFPLLMSIDLIPTVSILFYLYLISSRFKLSENRFLGYLNNSLSRYMLFAYLFHILAINCLFLFVPRDSLDLFQTILVAVSLSGFIIFTCKSLDSLISKFDFIRKGYSLIFG